MCPIFSGCGGTAVWMLRIKSLTKGYKGKTSDLLIAFIDYVNDLDKLQQFKVSVQKSYHRLQCTFQLSWQSTCSSPEVVLAFLLYEGSTIHNASNQFVSRVYFFFVDFAFHPYPQTKIGSLRASFKQLYLHTIENWTYVYMNLFTRNSPYYHLLKYLLFLMKHSVYTKEAGLRCIQNFILNVKAATCFGESYRSIGTTVSQLKMCNFQERL